MRLSGPRGYVSNSQETAASLEIAPPMPPSGGFTFCDSPGAFTIPDPACSTEPCIWVRQAYVRVRQGLAPLAELLVTELGFLSAPPCIAPSNNT